MPDTYSFAREVAVVAQPIIKQHHDHLISRRVEFLFVERFDKDGNSQAIVAKGKNLYGKAKLITGLNAFLGRILIDLDEREAGVSGDSPQPFFTILISRHFWDGATKEFKQALVDHELSHCWYDSEHDRYSMIEHDVAEFTAIVKRHGAWKADLDLFFKAAKQMKMPFAADAKSATGPRPVADLPPAS